MEISPRILNRMIDHMSAVFRDRYPILFQSVGEPFVRQVFRDIYTDFSKQRIAHTGSGRLPSERKLKPKRSTYKQGVVFAYLASDFGN
jgi:hypothetical protein